MNFFSFFSFFLKKNIKKKSQIKSELFQRIESLAKNSNLEIFSDLQLVHNEESYIIKLFIYDQQRGIYIFESKPWNFNELKNSTLKTTQNAQAGSNTLAFNKIHTAIEEKISVPFKDLPIFHYLLMENLSFHEYKCLDTSLQELLPDKNIFFKDEQTAEIFKKLQQRKESITVLPTITELFKELFIYYLIQDKEKNHLCTNEQISFINTKIQGVFVLKAPPYSAKSSLLILKSIKGILTKEYKRVILIKPTQYSKKRLYSFYEKIISQSNLILTDEQFQILTPVEFQGEIFSDIDLIICDDSDLLLESFLFYLKEYYKEKNLLFVNEIAIQAQSLHLYTSYKKNTAKHSFYLTNPHAKSLHLIASLLKENKATDIIIVSSLPNRKKLMDDLTNFIDADTYFLDEPSKLEQNSDLLLLTTYEDIVDLEAKYFIITDISEVPTNKVHYLFTRASKQTYILYEKETLQIQQLKERYESN